MSRFWKYSLYTFFVCLFLGEKWQRRKEGFNAICEKEGAERRDFYACNCV
jgi:hypothetical protein